MDALVSRAKNPSVPRKDRLQAIAEMAASKSDTALAGLVSVIDVVISDDEENRLMTTLTDSQRYPAIIAIKSRGENAVPVLVKRLLLLIDGGEKGSEEIRLICVTALMLNSIEELHAKIQQVKLEQTYEKNTVDASLAILNSFSNQFPKPK